MAKLTISNASVLIGQWKVEVFDMYIYVPSRLHLAHCAGRTLTHTPGPDTLALSALGYTGAGRGVAVGGEVPLPQLVQELDGRRALVAHPVHLGTRRGLTRPEGAHRGLHASWHTWV